MSSKWTASDIPRQDGRTAIVTGANSGIGLEAARELARAGAAVTLACRNAEKAEAALRDIKSSVSDAKVTVDSLDLSSLASVKDFAQRVRASHDAIDLLINNAGVMAPPRAVTADGFEMQFGTNHLGHFALTAQLLPSIQQREGARIVNVSSGMHRRGVMDFDDLQGERSYSRWGAYGQSKLANLLFTFELDRRLRAAGSPARSVAVHPGYASTHLQTTGPTGIQALVMSSIGNTFFAQSAAMGALPTLYAATQPDVEGGTYIGPDGLFEMRGHPRIVDCTDRAKSVEDARRLWEVSEQLTGVSMLSAAAAPASPVP